jgi:hypothetical protein
MRAAFNPIVRNEENPVPIPMIARCPDISANVAIIPAATLACRVTGCVTPVAARNVVVADRIAVNDTVTSRHNNCESINQTLSKPIRSAIAA